MLCDTKCSWCGFAETMYICGLRRRRFRRGAPLTAATHRLDWVDESSMCTITRIAEELRKEVKCSMDGRRVDARSMEPEIGSGQSGLYYYARCGRSLDGDLNAELESSSCCDRAVIAAVDRSRTGAVLRHFAHGYATPSAAAYARAAPALFADGIAEPSNRAFNYRRLATPLLRLRLQRQRRGRLR